MTESVGMDIYVRQKGIDGAAVSLEKLAKSADKASSANNKLTQEVKNTGTALEAAKKVAAGYFTYAFVKRALDVADKMSTINSQIRLVTASQEEAVSVQKELLKISNKTHASLEATATLYTRTARALKDTNKSQADFLKFSEAINNAMRLGGVGANEQTNALLQLSQALGSGRLQGDEYTSINENAPILLDLVAQKLGVARGELKALSSEGKITSEVIFSALTSASEQLARDAASMPITVGQALNVAGNELNMFADMMLNGTGVTRHMADAIIFLSKNIEFVLVPAIGVGAVMAVRTLAIALASLGAVGGPIALAIGALGALLIWLDKNSQKLDEMNAKIASAHTGINEMVEAQLKKHQQDIEIAVKVNTEELVRTERELARLEEKIKKQEHLVKNSPMRKRENKATLDSLNRQLIDVKNNIANITSETKSLKRQGEEAVSALQNLYERPFQKSMHDPDFKYSGENIDLGSMKEYLKLTKDIQAEGRELAVVSRAQKMELFLEADAYKNLNPLLKENLILLAGENDAEEERIRNSQSVVQMLDDLKEKADKAGKSLREVFLYDMKNKGATEDQIRQAEAELDRLATNTPTSGKSSIDHYTDRLQDMSRELSEILSLNKELETTGYSSQYNAVSQINLELNDQASTLYKISDAQKQILIGQAQQIDSAHQLNAIMNLGVDYSRRIEDMEFELELMGRSAQQVEEMRFAYELEQQAKLLSIGMSRENIAILEEEIQKYLELYGLVRKKKAEQENSIGEGVKQGMRDYIDSVGELRDQFADATMSTLGHMENFLFDFATTGKASFRDMTVSILKDLSRMMIQMAAAQAMKAALGYADGGVVTAAPVRNTGIFGGGEYDSGGYTGPGGKYEPAGIVHKDEFVFSKEATRNLGVDYLNGLHNSAKKGLRGYSSGGSVGGGNKSMQSNNQESPTINITIVQKEDGSVEADMFNQFGKKMDGKIKVAVKKEIAYQARDGGRLAR